MYPYVASELNKITKLSLTAAMCWAAVKVIQDFLLKDDPVFLQFINPIEEFNQSFSSWTLVPFLWQMLCEKAGCMFCSFVKWTIFHDKDTLICNGDICAPTNTVLIILSPKPA